LIEERVEEGNEEKDSPLDEDSSAKKEVEEMINALEKKHAEEMIQLKKVLEEKKLEVHTSLSYLDLSVNLGRGRKRRS
jgi:hypothetical protein